MVADRESRCKDYQLANLFPARAVALGVVCTTLEDRGLRIDVQQKEWVKDVGSGKVDHGDFEEVVNILKKKKFIPGEASSDRARCL